jgi:hypothetical protein
MYSSYTPQNQYKQLDQFAEHINNDYSKDPLFYCTTEFLDSQFQHGGAQGRKFGKYSRHCSEFLAARCAASWDAVCESVSQDSEMRYPNLASPLNGPAYTGHQSIASLDLTYGQQILRDAAFKKYKVKSFDCNLKCELFDPTVPNSPLICYETRTAETSGPDPSHLHIGNAEAGFCESVYKITPEQAKLLDQDPIMNKILNKPEIAMDLLERIYITMKQEKTLQLLHNTRLGHFYTYLGHSLN